MYIYIYISVLRFTRITESQELRFCDVNRRIVAILRIARIAESRVMNRNAILRIAYLRLFRSQAILKIAHMRFCDSKNRKNRNTCDSAIRGIARIAKSAILRFLRTARIAKRAIPAILRIAGIAKHESQNRKMWFCAILKNRKFSRQKIVNLRICDSQESQNCSSESQNRKFCDSAIHMNRRIAQICDSAIHVNRTYAILRFT